MIWYLTILPAGNLENAVAQILEKAKADPKIVTISRDASNHYLYFCETSDEADEERQQYLDYKVVSESLCSLTITEKGLSADMTGEGDSQKQLAIFLEWIFKTFAPCRVYDGETGDNLSEIARVNPAVILSI